MKKTEFHRSLYPKEQNIFPWQCFEEKWLVCGFFSSEGGKAIIWLKGKEGRFKGAYGTGGKPWVSKELRPACSPVHTAITFLF